LLFFGTLGHIISAYGYWVVAGLVGLESMGVPAPGETTLILAAVYAGSANQLNIWLVIVAGSAGAIMGDNLGYLIGRELGYQILQRWRHHIWLPERTLKIGQFLFHRHGGKIVLFARFVPLLRFWAAFLAGVDRMPWPRFFWLSTQRGRFCGRFYLA
jgi:membrane protein DedA with SNARE-associated domain